ncbi:MAG: phaA [Frankiales bacterium]|nr:phaA [Frankiales bacterium]
MTVTAPLVRETDLDDVVDAVGAADPVGVPTLVGLVRGVAGAFLRPGPVVRELGSLAADLGRVVKGTDELRPAPRDKRFADPTWEENAVYRRLAQGYVALGQALTRLVDSMDEGGADWHEVERARFAISVLASALAPTNLLPGNPAALKRAFETNGGSVRRGIGHLFSDLRHNGGMPSQTDRTAFQVGTHLALTPGAVVHRDEVAEVIQYSPSTSTVRQRPVLVVPPPIGRYYFLDLRPGRSFVEHAVGQGLQVFLISWRNPGPEQADWDLDAYAARIVSALEVVKEITGADDVNTLGFCAGGILQTAVLNAEAATGEHGIHSASYGVTLLDYDERAPLGAFSSPRLLALAGGGSRRKGVITARSLGSVFSWMRPDDLVFNYVVNQWLMGNPPPVFDILAWSADGTNLPARLHGQFLEIFRDNSLCRPGAMTVLDTPVDLSTIKVPTFVTGAVSDHLTPWTGCYRTTTAMSGPSTFVLSNAGHIASLVNPPGNPRASYHEGGPEGREPQEWLAGATQRTGSWWEAWALWVLERSGSEKPAPTELGDDRHRPLEPAPGGYVVDRVAT